MATLYFLKFNNYYNRTIKKKDRIADYQGIVFAESGDQLNFNKNDGVDTKITAGRYNNPYNGDCDYVIYSQDNMTITSRWFVVDQNFVCKGQYEVLLHRDIIADSYDIAVNSPCFIEKATLTTDNPLIYNSENISVNQIKKKETLLKDETGTNWVVGYISQGSINDGNEITIGLNPISVDIDLGNNDISTQDWWTKWNGTHKRVDEQPTSFSCGVASPGFAHFLKRYFLRPDKTSFITDDELTSPVGEVKSLVEPEVFFKNVDYDVLLDKLIEDLGYIPFEDYSTLIRLNGKVIRYKESGTSTTVTKKIVFVSEGAKPSESGGLSSTSSFGTEFWDKVKNNFNAKYTPQTFMYNNLGVTQYRLELENISEYSTTAKVTIPNARNHLGDAGYDMFVIPNHSITLNGVTTQDGMAIQIGSGLATALSSACYDVQLLPYCPIDGSKLSAMVADTKSCATIKDQNNQITTYMFFPKEATFGKTIPLEEPIVINEAKVQDICDMYRLVSPNFNGIFEFSATKNNGVSVFDVDCTYKPYSPYIHVNPIWNGLYGTIQNDSRGLICGGDFSIPRIDNAWVDYELQNKNYQNIFDREVQNMEITHKYQRREQLLSAGVGALSTGVMAGVAVGGVAGAVAGGVAGLASAGAGLADYSIQQKLYNETLSLKEDMFGMQLDNIKALPNSISKTSAIVANNKEYPVFEFYTCTEEERNAVREKIKWNGMTVGVIGKIKDYIQPTETYIKGKIIRFEGLFEDFHYANTLADELNKGVYL